MVSDKVADKVLGLDLGRDLKGAMERGTHMLEGHERQREGHVQGRGPRGAPSGGDQAVSHLWSHQNTPRGMVQVRGTVEQVKQSPGLRSGAPRRFRIGFGRGGV